MPSESGENRRVLPSVEYTRTSLYFLRPDLFFMVVSFDLGESIYCLEPLNAWLDLFLLTTLSNFLWQSSSISLPPTPSPCSYPQLSFISLGFLGSLPDKKFHVSQPINRWGLWRGGGDGTPGSSFPLPNRLCRPCRGLSATGRDLCYNLIPPRPWLLRACHSYPTEEKFSHEGKRILIICVQNRIYAYLRTAQPISMCFA